jgi:hypothetical protein
MASFARRDVRQLLSWPVYLLAVLLLSATGPAARAQVIQSAPAVADAKNAADNQKQRATVEQRFADPFAGSVAQDSQDPFAGPSVKPAALPTIKPRGPCETNDCSAQSEAAIRSALHEATTMDFTETPLQDAVDYLKDLHHIQIQLDTKALSDAGVSSDTPITCNLKGITLDSSLKILLSVLELTTVVTNGVLLITTPDAANQMIDVRVYDLSDMIDEDDNAEELAGLLQSLFVPGRPSESKDSAADRSPSSSRARIQLAPYQKMLLIRAPIIQQEELSRILSEMRDKLTAAK